MWKYIVQIPHEGYFTQTVQKTSCVKTKCDFMDGSCHESPRWVSLLVAEIFYPDARFPNPIAAPASHFEQFAAPAHTMSAYPQQHHHHHQQAMKTDKRQSHGYSVQQPHNKHAGSWRSVEDETPHASPSKAEAEISSLGNRRMRRQVGEEPSNDLDSKKGSGSNALSGSSSGSVAGSSSPDERECDGVDKIGCYTIRVYYDWFLVPGSCKCWKKSSQGSLDTLKKIFIGK